MTTSNFTSGKRAELGMGPANHDPEPFIYKRERYTEDLTYICPDPHAPYTKKIMRMPRPELDVPENPILGEFRNWRDALGASDPWTLDRFLDALGPDVRAPEAIREVVRLTTDAARDHARRVLSKLATVCA